MARSGFDTDIGCDAGHDQRVTSERVKRLVERRSHKAAVALFTDDRLVGQRLHFIELGAPALGAAGLTARALARQPRLGVSPALVPVADENHGDANAARRLN